jgi:signal peptidase I
LKKHIVFFMGLFFFLTLISPCSADEIKHTVVKGDTIWDISIKYLKTPWKWPLVWANNEDITNPHLIYPGDIVVISSEGGKTVIKVIPSPERQAKGDTQPLIYTPEEAAAVKEKTIVVSPQYSTYIYSPNLLTGSGTMIKKQELGELASQDEHIIIKTTSELKPGQGITIVSLLQDIKKGKETLGYLYKTVAAASVEEAQSNIVKARISYSLQEVKVGSVIFDDISSIKPLALSVSQPQLSTPAMIIDLYGAVSGSTIFDLVFMDAGKNQGVDKGALMSIARLTPYEDETIVFHDYLGMVLVLQALDNTSMGLVVESKARIDRGFTVTGKK